MKERGAVTALVVLFLPCLLACTALVVDVGVLLLVRAELQSAADLGALAGVQDLDFEELAGGVITIEEARARADTESWVRANLAGRSFISEGSVEVGVTVLDAERGGGEVCPVTGHPLIGPTVCVVLRGRVQLPFFPLAETVTVRVHADATVVGRP